MIAAGIAGVITLTEIKSASSIIDKVEMVISSSGGTPQEFQLRFKASATGTQYAFPQVDAGLIPSLRVNVTTEKATSVINQLDIPVDVNIKIIAGADGDIFIYDKNLHLKATDADFVTTSTGGIQLELKDLKVSNRVLFHSYSSGNFIIIIDAHNSSIYAHLDGQGTICFPSASSAVVSVYLGNKTDQVAFLEKQDAKFSCSQKPLPERRMVRLTPKHIAIDPNSPLYRDPYGNSNESTGVAMIILGVILVISLVFGTGWLLVVDSSYFARRRRT